VIADYLNDERRQIIHWLICWRFFRVDLAISAVIDHVYDISL
jgi:hypothetical protein